MRQPTIGEIEEYGEKEYFGIIKMLTSTPADRKVDIWDSLHIYWDQMDEFELFISVFLSLCSQNMSILMPSVDFSSFRTVVNPNTKEFMLINQDKVKIDRAIFTLLTNYLRDVHQMKKNRETGYDDFTKDCMIEDDRYDMQVAVKKPFQSIILPFASYLSLKIGFHGIWDVPIGAFFYDMMRDQKIRNYENLTRGIYSGCVDIKKINKNDLDLMGDL